MEIGVTLAQNIVNSIKETLSYEINFIDINGRVIASTDIKRIGLFHEGGRRVLETKKDLPVSSKDHFVGTREGFNTAVYFNKQIIGIIGITGPTSKVIKYAKIIRKLTELMITEAHLTNLDYTNRQHQQNIIEIITSKNPYYSVSDFSIIDYDISLSRRCIYTQFIPFDTNQIDLYNILNNIFPGETNLIVVQETFAILFVRNQKKDTLLNTIKRIQNHLCEVHNLKLDFGVGNVCYDMTTSCDSFLQSKHAYKWATKKEDSLIQLYEEMTIELLFVDWNHSQINAFNKKILGSLSDKEKIEYNVILKIYEKNNGALTKCSEELFIHKNTLQYRLNKLKDLTGYNPRILSDFVILKLAFLSEEIKQDDKEQLNNDI